MNGYWQIALCIILSAIGCGVLFSAKDKKYIRNTLLLCGYYYLVVSLFRTLQGHPTELLGQAFADKGMMGYIKVLVLIVVAFLALLVGRRFTRHILIDLYEKTISIFVFLQMITIACYTIPNLLITSVQGIISLVIAAILVIISCKKTTSTISDVVYNADTTTGDTNTTATTAGDTNTTATTAGNTNTNDTATDDTTGKSTLYAICSVVSWLFLFVINGPAEIFAYNSADFPYKYTSILPHLLLFAIVVIAISYGACKYIFSDVLCRIYGTIVLTYSAASYIQTMFLNGHMDTMQGGSQGWATSQLVINCIIWLVVILILLFIFLRNNKNLKLGIYVSLVIIALQGLSYISLIFTGGLSAEETRQLNQRNIYQVSNQNIIVFILDSYDSQMVDYVEERVPDFYNPLHDFTYYSRMKSHFDYTDGSLSYLMTAKLVDDYSSDDFKNSTFVKTISDYGYQIQTFTDKKFVQYLDGDYIANFTDDWYISLEHGKIVNQMIDCTRYRALPFALKEFYSYSDLELITCIDNSDVYIWGTDPDFCLNLRENGLNVVNDSPMMNIYHLYGAHTPYYLREDMSSDYNTQDPLQQWKACMSIVYEYIEQLKVNGVYDNSTIIIMADHGPGIKQREPLHELGIEFSDDLHPIFFVKQAGEQHDELIKDDSDVSHDDYFGTIIQSIDSQNSTFGNAIWSK